MCQVNNDLFISYSFRVFCDMNGMGGNILKTVSILMGTNFQVFQLYYPIYGTQCCAHY